MIRGMASVSKRSEAPVMMEMASADNRIEEKAWKLLRYQYKNRLEKQPSHFDIAVPYYNSIGWKSTDCRNPANYSPCRL